MHALVLPRDELSEFLSGYKKTIAEEKLKVTCHNMKIASRDIGSIPITSNIFLSEWLRGIAMFDKYVIRYIMWESNKSVNIGYSVDV